MGGLLVFGIVALFLQAERLVRFFSMPLGLVVLLAGVVSLGVLVRGTYRICVTSADTRVSPVSLAVTDRQSR